MIHKLELHLLNIAKFFPQWFVHLALEDKYILFLLLPNSSVHHIDIKIRQVELRFFSNVLLHYYPHWSQVLGFHHRNLLWFPEKSLCEICEQRKVRSRCVHRFHCQRDILDIQSEGNALFCWRHESIPPGRNQNTY